MLKARKKKPKKKGRFNAFSRFFGILPPRYRAKLLIGLCISVVGAIVIVAAYQYMIRLPVFKVKRGHLAFVSLPDWVTPSIRRELMNPPGVPGEFSIFDDRSVRRVHTAYANYSWVKEVKSVRKVYPNKIALELSIRKPVVRIRNGAKFYLADREGVRLATAHYDTEAFRSLPFIYGMKESLPRIGGKWGKEVRAGIEVALILQAMPFYDKLNVTAVQVSNLYSRVDPLESEVVVWTENQTRIMWGRPSLTAIFGELPVADKVANLEKVLAERPGLKGLRVVRLQYDDPVFSTSRR